MYLGVVASQLYDVEVSSPRQRERAGRVLGELVDLGLIERELPRPGRPTGSRTGEGRGPDYLIRVAGNPPQAGGDSVPETHPKRAGNPPQAGGDSVPETHPKRAGNPPQAGGKPTPAGGAYLGRNLGTNLGRDRNEPSAAAREALMERERRRREGCPKCSTCEDLGTLDPDPTDPDHRRRTCPDCIPGAAA